MLDERDDVVVAEYERLAFDIRLGLGHQPDAHLGHDPEVRLREDAVEVGAVAVLELLPRLESGRAPMPVRTSSPPPVTTSSRNARPSDRDTDSWYSRRRDLARCRSRCPSPGRGIDPKLELALLDVAIQIEIAHAGLDERIGVALVDLEDAVHPLQIEHDAT